MNDLDYCDDDDDDDDGDSDGDGDVMRCYVVVVVVGFRLAIDVYYHYLRKIRAFLM